MALKEIKSNLRDRRSFLFMLAFPIVLILILGTALSGMFDSNIKIGEIKVLYQDNNGGGFSTYFEKVTEEVAKSDIIFTKNSSNLDGQEEVKQNRYDAFVELSPNGVQVYGSNLTSIQSTIVQGVMSTVVDKYNAGTEITKVNPAAIQLLAGNNNSTYIKETSLHSPNKPGAMDYYALATTASTALYGAISALYLLRGERNNHTADRLLAAPISITQIVIGKILGAFVIQSLFVLIVILVTKYAYNANWGDHIGVIIAIYLSQVLLAISFGIGLSYMTKSDEGARSIVMIVVQVLSFIGGAYFAIDPTKDQIVNIVAHLSPITWVRLAATKIIYTGDVLAALPAIGFNIGIAAILLLIAIFSMRKREGI
ncbi:ABC transporter permease [Paenibacillus sp. N1-5-1-14]|nr:ABC transporter permease [Paenibacillus radicibacter]